ncbi:hypothetical protein HDU84_005866 [Entophlyctis sp. JEL0112]|nr:hypothetical protein HDU84_005866 [Entophlyctis sp. JEL0112]
MLPRRVRRIREAASLQTQLTVTLFTLALALLAVAAVSAVVGNGLASHPDLQEFPVSQSTPTPRFVSQLLESPPGPTLSPTGARHPRHHRQYIALASIPAPPHASLRLLAEWIHISKILNRTLILPQLAAHEICDKSSNPFQLFVSPSAVRSDESVRSLEDLFQLGQGSQCNNCFGGDLLSLNAMSDAIIHPLADYVDVIEIDEFVGRMKVRFAKERKALSVVFVNNMENRVECSTAHDALDWPDWASQNTELLGAKLMPVSGIEFSDVCVFSLGHQSNSNPEDLDRTDLDEDSEDDEFSAGDTSRNHREQVREEADMKQNLQHTAESLFANPDVLQADLIVVRKLGSSQLLPSSFISPLIADTLLFPHKNIYSLVRTLLHGHGENYTPVLAVRWALPPESTISPEVAHSCASSLLLQIKKTLKMQNWNSGFVPTSQSADVIYEADPLNQDPRRYARVYLSFGGSIQHNNKSAAASSAALAQRHVASAQAFLRRRVRGFLDLAGLVSPLVGMMSGNTVFWRVFEEAVFEVSDIALLGISGGECHSGGQGDDEEFSARVRHRRNMRAKIIYPDVGDDDTDAARDSRGMRIVYRTLAWR